MPGRTHRRFVSRAGMASAMILGSLLQAGSAVTQVQEPQQCFRYIDEPMDACSTCSALCYGRGYKCCGIIVLPT